MCADEVRGKLDEFQSNFNERSKQLPTIRELRGFAKPLIDAVTLLVRNTGTSKVQQEVMANEAALWGVAKLDKTSNIAPDSATMVGAVMLAVDERIARAELATQNKFMLVRHDFDSKIEELCTLTKFDSYVTYNDARVGLACELMAKLKESSVEKTDVNDPALAELPELEPLVPVNYLDAIWRQTQVRLTQAVMLGGEDCIGDIAGMITFGAFVANQPEDFPKPSADSIRNIEQVISSYQLTRMRRTELWNYIAPLITSSEALAFQKFVHGRVMSGDIKKCEIWDCFKFKTFGNAERARKSDGELKKRREAKKQATALAVASGSGTLVYQAPTAASLKPKAEMLAALTMSAPKVLGDTPSRKRKLKSTLSSVAPPSEDFAEQLRSITQSKWAESRALERVMKVTEDDPLYEDQASDDSS